MTKTYCDICNKEINYWKSEFQFPLSKAWNGRVVIEHICDDCYKDVNSYILQLVTNYILKVED